MSIKYNRKGTSNVHLHRINSDSITLINIALKDLTFLARKQTNDWHIPIKLIALLYLPGTIN